MRSLPEAAIAILSCAVRCIGSCEFEHTSGLARELNGDLRFPVFLDRARIQLERHELCQTPQIIAHYVSEPFRAATYTLSFVLAAGPARCFFR